MNKLKDNLNIFIKNYAVPLNLVFRNWYCALTFLLTGLAYYIYRRIGYVNPEMTLKIYSHSMEKSINDENSKINSLFS